MNINRIFGIAVLVATALTSTQGFAQMTFDKHESSEAVANRMRANAYSRLANMGVEMPAMPQHSMRGHASFTPLALRQAPEMRKLEARSDVNRTNSSVQLWNPLSWFSWEKPNSVRESETSQRRQLAAPISSRARASSSSFAGGSSVSASGNGAESLAVSNVNGWISIDATCVIDGKPERIQMQGSEISVRRQIKALPKEAGRRILKAIGN